MAVLTFQPQTSFTDVVALSCGTSSSPIGGVIDLSNFPNLTVFQCNNNNITTLTGYGGLTQLQEIIMRENAFVQSGTEAFSNKPNLRSVDFNVLQVGKQDGWTGTFPDFSSNTQLEYLLLNDSNLSGRDLNFSNNTALRNISIYRNRIAGAFPVLPTGINSNIEYIHVGSTTNKTFGLTGTPPQFADHPKLVQLYYYSNRATGPLEDFSALPDSRRNAMMVVWCQSNFHTGTISDKFANGFFSLRRLDLSSQRGTTKLTGDIFVLNNKPNLFEVRLNSNQLSGFAAGDVASIELGVFIASSNLLTTSAINNILAAFVAGGRTSANGTCSISIGGTGNAAPTGQGLTDKATLISRGWSVATN